ncbi:MAG: PaaI family thioesterase [Flavobacteriales bacterium]|nr:PaaI family thioesterase [Flavobacteriales bacterium]
MHITEAQLAQVNAMRRNTLVEHLGIEFIPSPEGTVAATMPVNSTTHQPMGILHGGATVALAETVGSMGSAMLVDLKKHGVVGIEVNANHLKAVRSGKITCTGTLIHHGRSTHVWDFKVTNDQRELVAVCRLVVMVTTLKEPSAQ